ncbi:CRISPR-associated endonuclease Cas9 REC1/REC2 domain-containing protein [Lactobacillus crispatus]|nr:Uncharacterised protein [Lactobacillus acidophilus]
MCFFVQTNHTRKELLFLMFKEINLRNHSSLHKLFYSLEDVLPANSLLYQKYTVLDELNKIPDLKLKCNTKC